MTDLALHLTDRVIPFVPVRQLVLSLPPRVRHLLAYDLDASGRIAAQHAANRDALERILRYALIEQKPLNQILVSLARELALPLVASNDCHYLERQHAHAQMVLQCISAGVGGFAWMRRDAPESRALAWSSAARERSVCLARALSGERKRHGDRRRLAGRLDAQVQRQCAQACFHVRS